VALNDGFATQRSYGTESGFVSDVILCAAMTVCLAAAVGGLGEPGQ
jgi:hypothetical protein